MADYVPADAFIPLDLRDLAASIDTVERCLDEDPYDQRLGAIAEARQGLIDEHNIFAVLQRLILALAPGAQGARLTAPDVLRSNGSFDVASQVFRHVKAAWARQT